MLDKKFFNIPSEEEQKNYQKERIKKASDDELYDIYEEITYNIKYCPSGRLVDKWKDDKKFLVDTMKSRNLVVPTFLNKIKHLFIAITKREI